MRPHRPLSWRHLAFLAGLPRTFLQAYGQPVPFRVKVRGRPALLGLAVLAGLWGASTLQASGPNRAGLVVAHADGSVVTRCVEFGEDQITGYDLLDRSGLDLNVEQLGAEGLTVCRLDGEGCDFPQEPCFCECTGGGSNCVYWSYWHLASGGWQYSAIGAAQSSIRNGSVDGWVWGLGNVSAASPPPAIPFEQICLPATATPTHTPPPSPTPTSVPSPTPASQPPEIDYFRADRVTVNAGESVTLSWDLAGAQAAYLRFNGIEEGVVAPGSKTVSPVTTTRYVLVARNQSGEVLAEVTIQVIPASPVTSTPTLTPAPSHTAGPAAVAAAVTATPALASPSPTQPPPEATLVPDTPAPTAPAAVPLATRPASGASPTPTPTPASLSAAGPATTRPSLLRQASPGPEPEGPAMLLGVIGVVALLGGLVGTLILLLAGRGQVRR